MAAFQGGVEEQSDIVRRITFALHRSNSVAAVGRLPSALYRPTASTPLPGERVVIRSYRSMNR